MTPPLHEPLQSTTLDQRPAGHPAPPEGAADPCDLCEALLAQVAEANTELRQVLQQVSGQLELALVDLDLGRGPPSRALLYELFVAADRAAGVVDARLDASRAVQRSLQLQRVPFDLAESVGAALARGLAQGPGGDGDGQGPGAGLRRRRLSASSAWVLGDPGHLTAAVGLLADFLERHAEPHERVVVRIGPAGGLVEGFVGLQPSHLAPEHLLAAVDARAPRDLQHRLSYARAVIERHGGLLVVARGQGHEVGFLFTLPATDGPESA